MPARTFYDKVALYYDRESIEFERNYKANPILQRLRADFRAITERYHFDSALEIGCGPGFDLEYFARHHEHTKLRGIDVSPAMIELSRQRLEPYQNQDVNVQVADIEHLDEKLDTERFDLIYCYFGALNTVEDLNYTAEILRRRVNDNSTLVLTFVNKWFLFDILWNILRLRWRRSISRLRRVWSGYAPDRPLPSRCHSAREVKQAFGACFKLHYRKGYSIVYPAWFRHRFLPVEGRLGEVLWRIDRFFNRTPFWNLGEYSLYVFKPR